MRTNIPRQTGTIRRITIQRCVDGCLLNVAAPEPKMIEFMHKTNEYRKSSSATNSIQGMSAVFVSSAEENSSGSPMASK